MIQVPWLPLVIATGRPRHSGRSRCSMDAKKAFMSTSTIARGQTSWWRLLVSGSPVQGVFPVHAIGGSQGTFMAGSGLVLEYCDYIQHLTIMCYLQFVLAAAERWG